MIKNLIKLICFAMIPLLTSCIKEGFDKENCPGEYTITPLNPDETNDGNNSEMAGSINTLIGTNGSEQEVNIGSAIPIDLEDGSYTVVVVKGSESPDVTLTGTTIQIATGADGTAKDVPEDVQGGYEQITVNSNAADKGNTNFDVHTHIQSRPLEVRLNFEGGNASLIESISGVIDGIALSRDLNNGFIPVDGQDRHPATESGSIHYDFGKKEGSTATYTDSHRLLGIDGDGTQTLTVTVNYAGGVQKTYTFDVTRSMDGFHTQDVLSPWILEFTFRLGADFTADIEEWQWGTESSMDAH